MNMQTARWPPGVLAALGSALLFGAGTPLAKWLLGQMSPWLLAGLLYLGSGIGLGIYRWLRGAAGPCVGGRGIVLAAVGRHRGFSKVLELMA